MKTFKYTINGNVYEGAVNSIGDISAEVEVNGTPYKVQIGEPETKAAPLQNSAQTPEVAVSKPSQPASASAMKSPLPGVILDITCKVGDVVKKGQKVLILEAMKMENAINADRDGEILEIIVNKGESVLEGADLVVIG
ncbi:MAG: biotin/lipoyl-binding protein [Bacteroidales bacterium]|jgi:biotin carboxyl carrier protein|nr:biotin/lipoyl-binding protein [Bacteroidales bacterium]